MAQRANKRELDVADAARYLPDSDQTGKTVWIGGGHNVVVGRPFALRTGDDRTLFTELVIELEPVDGREQLVLKRTLWYFDENDPRRAQKPRPTAVR